MYLVWFLHRVAVEKKAIKGHFFHNFHFFCDDIKKTTLVYTNAVRDSLNFKNLIGIGGGPPAGTYPRDCLGACLVLVHINYGF